MQNSFDEERLPKSLRLWKSLYLLLVIFRYKLDFYFICSVNFISFRLVQQREKGTLHEIEEY